MAVLGHRNIQYQSEKMLRNSHNHHCNTGAMDTWQHLSIEFETTADTRGATLAIEKGTRAKTSVKLWLDDAKLELIEAP